MTGDAVLDRLNDELLRLPPVVGVTNPTIRAERQARIRTKVREITDRVVQRAGLSAPVARSSPPELVTRFCRSCSESFDQPRRHGRLFSYCERCRKPRSEVA